MSAALQMASSTARQISRNWSLPNILTYARVAAVPLVAGVLFWPHEPWARWTALAIFVAAGVSDFFDGYLARAWSQQSSLGRMLDPIADKLLVSAVILVLAADQTISGLSLWAAIVILCREILVSGLREYLAELRVPLPVTALAKWKTAVQFVALGFLIVAGMALALYFLFRSLNKQLHKITPAPPGRKGTKQASAQDSGSIGGDPAS